MLRNSGRANTNVGLGSHQLPVRIKKLTPSVGMVIIFDMILSSIKLKRDDRFLLAVTDTQHTQKLCVIKKGNLINDLFGVCHH